MERIDLINNFGKIFVINIFVYFIYIKISNYNDNSKRKLLLMILSNILISLIYCFLILYVQPIFAVPIIYLLLGITIKKILKQKFNFCVFVVIISLIVTYMIYLISVLISGMTLKLLIPNIDYKSPISLLTIPTIMGIIYYFILNTKRLKNGLNFLSNKEKVEKIGKFTNVMLLLTIIICGLLQDSENVVLNTILLIGTLFTFCCIVIWIQSQITRHYRKNMKDLTIEIQKVELDEQLKIIEEVKEENLKLGTVVHKYNNRLSALEMAMKNAIELNESTEFADELAVILKETEEISQSFAKESKVANKKLPLTNIPGIDNMFKYMQEEAIKNDIEFDLKINESINGLIEKVIPKDKFETLLGDHLRDAIIAVNSSNIEFKSILVTLGIIENCYELSIYDTGIPFEIDTLIKLGKERVTTHKNSGGSGIGFMTTFETLQSCKASLIIEEYNPKTTHYTKSVNIRFDGKNNYKIYSYRAEKIKELNTNKVIIVQKMI